MPIEFLDELHLRVNREDRGENDDIINIGLANFR